MFSQGGTGKSPLSVSLLITEKHQNDKKTSHKKLSNSKGKERNSVAKKTLKSNITQQRKYSIFSSSADSESESTGYVDVSRENRLRKESAKEELKI
jgi:hypothetical protein